MEEFKVEFPDESIELIKEFPKLNWSQIFSNMLFKELSKTSFLPEHARKLSDSFGEQIFSQIKDKF